MALSCYSGAEDLSSEKSTLCSFDDLLVDGAGRMVHHYCAFLVVNLGVDSGVTDEIDNPLLALVLTKTQPHAEVLNIDTGMNLAVAL